LADLLAGAPKPPNAEGALLAAGEAPKPPKGAGLAPNAGAVWFKCERQGWVGACRMLRA
jgi:hypothetical protein